MLDEKEKLYSAWHKQKITQIDDNPSFKQEQSMSPTPKRKPAAMLVCKKYPQNGGVQEIVVSELLAKQSTTLQWQNGPFT